MSVNPLNIKNSVKNLLIENNTNTSSYDISDSLQRRVQYITSANSRQQPVLNILYPAVFVELRANSDDHIEMGNSGRRDTEIQIDIVPVVDIGQGTDSARETSDDECALLTYNILNLIRNNITLSSTVDWCSVNATYEIDEGTYNSQSRIELLIIKRG